LKISLEKHNTPETSVKEGLDFEEYLLSKKIWNRTLIKDGVCDNVFGAEIEVLSPNEMQLKKLLREYVKNENSYTASANKDWDKDITDLIEQDEELPVDRSPTNQSSIAFILTVEGKKFLFLGDASSDQITSKLSSLGYSKNNPISVECLKISHHGSKNNTSNELLDIINTDQYFISTDGSRHSHPNKITLARILKRNPKAAIHFNYEHIKDAIFNDHDFDNFQLMKVYHSIELEF
jgi:hypothetical protein